MEIIGPEKIKDLVIKAIEFNAGPKSQLSVFFSCGDSPATALIVKVMYYKTCNGKWMGYVETIEANDYYIMVLATVRLEKKIKELADTFMRRFKKGEVIVDEDGDDRNGNLSESIANAINNNPDGWY